MEPVAPTTFDDIFLKNGKCVLNDCAEPWYSTKCKLWTTEGYEDLKREAADELLRLQRKYN